MLDFNKPIMFNVPTLMTDEGLFKALTISVLYPYKAQYFSSF